MRAPHPPPPLPLEGSSASMTGENHLWMLDELVAAHTSPPVASGSRQSFSMGSSSLKRSTLERVCKSVTNTCLSLPPEYTLVKEGSTARAQTESWCMAKVCTQRCCPKSHSRTVLSEDPLRHRRPEASSTSAFTFDVWPLSLNCFTPVRGSHTRRLHSVEPDTIMVAVSLTASEYTDSLCPFASRGGWPSLNLIPSLTPSALSRSHMNTSPPRPPEMNFRARGATTKDVT
mmetsp:Transcript_17452/g.37995  ORF Transcript_17452/g.37995 Transcript_17452/m.37995 type:complete len:230 (+) Transcript_17452:469-1158(+)